MHWLALPPQVTSEQLFFLARCRFPRASYSAANKLLLARNCHLEPPRQATTSELQQLNVPSTHPILYKAIFPRERGATPWDHLLQSGDAISRIFATGLPTRGEAAAVQWLVDVARHLQGIVVLDQQSYRPDPQVSPGFEHYSNHRLPSETLAQMLRQAAPGKTVEIAQDAQEDFTQLDLDLQEDGWISLSQLWALDGQLPEGWEFLASQANQGDGSWQNLESLVQYRVTWHPPEPEIVAVESGFDDGSWEGMQVLDGHLLDPSIRIARNRARDPLQRLERILQQQAPGLCLTLTGFPLYGF